MSDTTSDTTSDTPLPPRPPVRHSQRQILELAHGALTELPAVDPDETRFVPTVTGRELGAGGELLKLVFEGGETWWITAVRGGAPR